MSKSSSKEPRARRGVRTHPPLPSPGGAEAPPASPISIPDRLARLVQLQRERQFCIVSQNRIDRACESFIAGAIGYSTDLTEKERKAKFALASAFRRRVEGKGGAGHPCHANQGGYALSACTPIVANSAAARQAWDSLRAKIEAEMQMLARELPAWRWAEAVSGLSAQGFACIIGETGDLANYETKERVWKRLGLAVIDGIAQQRRTNAEQAAAHGYSPKRRATVWAIADVLLRQQWRGEREGKPAHPIGPYGAVYGRRKAHTVNRDGWTPKHRDNDARRVMSKALIEDLWRVWRGMEPLASMPPSLSLA
ncbi:hypothetical protein GXW71_28180 [Roseomonas hellenica]|uniref:Uncharacterized protein n=1 Tax=Plastoroseomonas hellenica TaxID=2687306 RepID=A0ABS5F6T3_9PROT|nr:hypothetical protein [Plastoroseomonas hellenica]MBR0668263.1 hypothetical protein [Plastoroseomonas hellenica]